MARVRLAESVVLTVCWLCGCGPVLGIPAPGFEDAGTSTDAGDGSTTTVGESDPTQTSTSAPPSGDSGSVPPGLTQGDTTAGDGESADSTAGDSASAQSASDDNASGETTAAESSTGAPEAPSPIAHYEVTILNTWTERSHPGALPSLAHFSWLGGATHDDAVTFWETGALASPGLTLMAEIGNTDLLSTEVAVAIEAGHADAALQWQQWFCPPGTDVSVCGESTVSFDVSLDFPRVTLVSMLGPSPDLFVGASSLPLLMDGQWVEALVVDLVPYDAGTRSDVDFTMNGALQDPPLPIALITSTDDHLIGPASLGTMTLVRLPDDAP